ncbi:NAD(P)H-hydrate dehydratase [Ideonella paludis]|uniref:Bifunctional NAD(P)H-hydrate repair enzyme n=1 Tax=Ideonella paludis TaxID=1233411 RepID=A0ABS5DUU3_9BURK|nr:NAD(P)H-hydrate dehydratase [Ideonella paludis]MBQ0934902.1 NAD(P)H-hydrate dehydratase [Ideonella paludis]
MPSLRLVPFSELTPAGALWLHDTAASRALEAQALAAHPPYTLMARAGLAVARWTRALAPHARHIWVAVGPGHNGGDGLAAAAHWAMAGCQVTAFLWGHAKDLPPDAQTAFASACKSGVQIQEGVALLPRPDTTDVKPDVVVDALLGLGHHRAPDERLRGWIAALNAWRKQGLLLAIDVPTGLCSDHGTLLGAQAIEAHATLSLLTLKPGLFTHSGRQHSGEIWFDGLATSAHPLPPAAGATASLTSRALARSLQAARPHQSHKGSFGDVWVVGGATGMEGAATLAASAALQAGAGRVLVAPLSGQREWAARPELMWRSISELLNPGVVERATVVCGCGGGNAVARVLPELLQRAPRLVLDADALNALSADPALSRALSQRAGRQQLTLLTPHPLEAARLAHSDTAHIQHQRLHSAQHLAAQTQACVVLKGSGTVVAQVGHLPWVNCSGNARLSTPGSGDVLAGWLGGLWSQRPDTAPEHLSDLAAAVVWLHGCAAELADEASARGSSALPLLASQLPDAMARAVDALSATRP